jgi:CHAT domain-containing protein/Tfp pilus assembly protein PilF
MLFTVAAAHAASGVAAIGVPNQEPSSKNQESSQDPETKGASDPATLDDLGTAAMQHGELDRAEQYYRQALALRQKLAADSLDVAASLMNLAAVARQRGDLGRADEYDRRALDITGRLEPDGLMFARILTDLAEVAMDRGDTNKAEAYLARALTINLERAPASLSVATDLEELGKLAERRGDIEKAEKYGQQARAIQQKLAPGSLEVAEDLRNLGAMALARGELDKAEEYDRQALALWERLAPGTLKQAETMAALSSILRKKKDLAGATQLLEQAVNVLESQIARVGADEELRMAFGARYLSYYTDLIDLLVEEKQLEHAFEIAERSRARTLLEALASSQANLNKKPDPALLERGDSLQAALNAKSESRVRLLSGQHTQQQVAALDQEINDLLAQYRLLKEQIELGKANQTASTKPLFLSGKQVQQRLLDSDTVLLEYSLGDRHSYVFAVTPDSVEVYELPKRAQIEEASRHLYHLLSAESRDIDIKGAAEDQTKAGESDRAASRAQAAAELSEMVLGPLASELGGKRLLIVADGGLEYIPFASLPVPGPPQKPPLMAEHEVIALPSASALALLRERESGRTQAPKAVAILADPVFDAGDSRVEPKASSQAPDQQNRSQPAQDKETRSAAEFLASQTGPIHRLPFTRREANAIVAAAGASRSLEALDFKASRNTATSQELAQYQVVHFATCGLVNPQHPELSGLVLSLVDQHGKAQDGFLSLAEISNLDLPAKLVVLSASETGLGKRVDGEGLIGLTRGFMYAGASRVVSSMWKVDDAATAELMQHFYEAMEKEGMTPAAALRKAQFEMWEQKRWKAPYYWAAFQLQGEWK